MIDPYEKILMVMRDQGKTDDVLLTGILKPDKTLEIGDLILEEEDYAALNQKPTTEEDAEVIIAALDDRFIILGKVVE